MSRISERVKQLEAERVETSAPSAEPVVAPESAQGLNFEEAPKVTPPRSSARRSASKEAPIRSSHKVLAEELSVIIGASFAGISFALDKNRDTKIWPLDNREASELGAAIAEAVPSLPAKKADALAKAVPPLRLAITVASIVGIRVKMELDARRLEKIAAEMNARVRRPQQTEQVQAPDVRDVPPPSNGKILEFDIPGRENA